MNSEIRKTLEAVKNGELSVDDALLAIKKEPFEDIGYAKVDLHRGIRQGAAEVIYGAGKTPEQIAGIVEAMKKRGQETILITRVDEEKSLKTEKLLSEIYPDGSGYRYFKDAKVAICGNFPEKDGVGTIVVGDRWDQRYPGGRRKPRLRPRHSEIRWSASMMWELRDCTA